MPRPPRILVPGAIYHFYNRVSSGEPILGLEGEAERLIDLMLASKERDGWTVFAWCVLSNHYHLVLRSGEPPLWRGLHRVQNLFSRSFNRRHERTGPLWQSRYNAKVVEDESYLGQLVLYVHANPARAGLVRDPGNYPYSGHAEIASKQDWRLMDTEQSLLCFGDERRRALSIYFSGLRAAVEETLKEHSAQEPIALPAEDEPLRFPKNIPYVDALGKSTAPERPALSAREFLSAACSELAIDIDLLSCPRKDRNTVRLRRLITTLAVERWQLQSGDLARELGKLVEAISRLVGEGVQRRLTDSAFLRDYEALDRSLLAALRRREDR